MLEVHDRCEIACEILKATNDGDDLAPEHLYLVQALVNGNITEKGIQLMIEVRDQVKSKTYKRPWLCLSHIKLDPRPGYYYASIKDCDKPTRFGFLAGPFPTHQQALDILAAARDKALEVNNWAVFHSFGTCRLPADFPDPPRGVLNDLLGVQNG